MRLTTMFGVVLMAVIGCRSGGSDSTSAATAATTATTAATVDGSTAAATAKPHDPVKPKAEDPSGTYMGRTLAPTMSHLGAPWLTRERREAEEKTSLMIEALDLQPGQTACDLGAGNGYHTLLMAREVAPDGRAIAVDIQPEMLSLLRERATDEGIDNIETILGQGADPKLPDAACDLILMADVYHELDDPEAMLSQLSRALAPKGRLALLEFREEDPTVPIKPLHKMSKAQVRRELEANGYVLASSYDELPWQHLLMFAYRPNSADAD